MAELRETPADEYERVLTERREMAVVQVSRYAMWWLGGQVATTVLWLGAYSVATSLPGARPQGDAVYWATLFPLSIAAAIAGFFTFELSVVVAAFGLRHFSLLSWRWVVTAGAVWIVTVTELLCLWFLS